MGFAGRMSGKRHREQIKKALRNGGTKHASTNTEVTFDGEAEQFVTFEGLRWSATGFMTFRHYDTPVLAVDFERDMITDFGYTGFSMTTNTNLSAWYRELRDMEFMRMACLQSETNPFRWTTTNLDYFFARGAGHAKEMFMRFRAGVPWVKVIDGIPWFCGRSYNQDLEDRFDRVRTEVLRDGVSWHWYTADWDNNGMWNKRFIDEAAQVRWMKREAKHRQTTTHQTTYDSSVENAA